jgi:4-hydroxy-2-oxoheptanedioate aldolase
VTLQSSEASLNRLKALWRQGKTALGAIATIPSVQTVQVMARSGLDFVIIGMEYGAVDARIRSAIGQTPNCAVDHI